MLRKTESQLRFCESDMLLRKLWCKFVRQQKMNERRALGKLNLALYHKLKQYIFLTLLPFDVDIRFRILESLRHRSITICAHCLYYRDDVEKYHDVLIA